MTGIMPGSAGNDGGGNVTLYNIGSEHGATNLEVIEMARRVTGRPIPVRECPRRPGDAPASLASAGKIRSELGWEPAVLGPGDDHRQRVGLAAAAPTWLRAFG